MLYVLLLIFPLLIYAFFSAAILFHLKKYGIGANPTKNLSAIFIIISLILIAFTSAAFFNIPWNSVNLSNIIQSIFPPQNPQINNNF